MQHVGNSLARPDIHGDYIVIYGMAGSLAPTSQFFAHGIAPLHLGFRVHFSFSFHFARERILVGGRSGALFLQFGLAAHAVRHVVLHGRLVGCVIYRIVMCVRRWDGAPCRKRKRNEATNIYVYINTVSNVNKLTRATTTTTAQT